MTDQPKPSKFKCVLKGFFIFLKWVFVLILAVLLIAGLYFHAPWKVLTLLTIILSAITILPKRFRKYFYITTTCIIVAVTIWVFLPEDNTAWKPYTLDDELIALNAKYQIPDDQNAAIIYEQFSEQYDDEQFTHPLKIDREIEYLLRSEPWKSEDYPELADWLSINESIFEPIFATTQKSRLSFQYTINKDGIDIKMRMLSKIKKLTKILAASACNDFAEGRVDLALKKNHTILTIGRQFQQTQPFINNLVGYALEHTALKQLYPFIIEGQLNHDQLQYIDSYLGSPQENWQQTWQNSIEFEKLYFKNSLLRKNYEVNDKGKVRLSRSADILSFPMLLRYLGIENSGKKNVIIKWFYMPSSTERFVSAMDAALVEYDDIGNPDYTWTEVQDDLSLLFWGSAAHIFENYSKHIEDFSSNSYPAFKKIHEMYLGIRAKRNAVRICLGLKYFRNSKGKWLRNLDALKPLMSSEIFTDPTNGSAYVYTRDGDEFTLYSKGLNGIDDNGEKGISYEGSTRIERDDYQFWPPETRLKEAQAEIDRLKTFKGMPGMPMPGMDPNMIKMMRMPGMPDMGMPGMTNTE